MDEERQLRILIIEDSETQRVILRHILEKEGWLVVSSSSAEEALDMLMTPKESDLPDLFIIDYNMPGIEGDELCRRLKLNIYTRSIPILVLISENGEDTETYALNSGADDYLPKYTEDEIFVLHVRSLLRKARKPKLLLGVGSPFFQRSRILVVDKDPDYLDFLENSFKEDGMQITRSTECTKNAETLLAEKFDCILIGMNETSSDEYELCKKIMDLRPSLDDPAVVLVLMSHETREDMTRALEAGADDFVARTSDVSIIKARMIALLRRKFIQEDNQRIFEELKRKELEVERSRIEKAAAEAKAVLAEKLLITVEQLEDEIDERKKMERQIKKYSRELERSNKELEAFAYVASHDLQEPLRAISSYLQLVEKRYKEKIDEKGKDFINRAVNGARRMQEMINDLLIYSRITTRARSFERCSFEAIIDRALANLSAAIERNNVQITRDPMPELICDEAQVIRLFQNLISNAIKFCDKKSPEIHLAAQKQDRQDEWKFLVKDNGIGIESEHKDNIFKIFHRLHSRDKFPGTGIGLAICQKIVERHGGKIWVESTVGEGSSFYFTIHRMDMDTDGEANE